MIRRSFLCACFSAALASSCSPFTNDAPFVYPPPEIEVEAGPPCDPTQAFGTPTPVFSPSQLNTSSAKGLRLSRDYLTAYFGADGLNGGLGVDDIYVAERLTAGADTPFFGLTPIDSTTINNARDQADPTITGDGLTLVYSEVMPSDPSHLWSATRVEPSEPFAQSLMLGISLTDGGTYDESPFVREDGQVLYFASNRVGLSEDIFRAVVNPRSLERLDWMDPTPVVELNTPGANELAPVVTPDDRVVYFASDRGTDKHFDIWMATRPGTDAGFSTPTAVDALNTGPYQVPTFITRDGCTLYFASTMTGSLLEYVATRTPP